ncbi:MAG: IS1380 family transposase, partial [Mariprofundaceae bacterium]|nr:IS1380 family transposase [Mariprofundaceae bacterium]
MSKDRASQPRKSMPKVRVEGTGKHLTTHAGLIPAMRFLEKLGFRGAFTQTVEHGRGANARYHLVDAAELSLLAMIVGARYLDG